MSLVPVTLTEPKSDTSLDSGSTITLCWSYVHDLSTNEYFRLRIWGTGVYSNTSYHKEDIVSFHNLPAGDYKWDVAIVRDIGQDEYLQISKDSGWNSFKIVFPRSPTIVHSLSPTSTLQGTGESVALSGENLTRPLTITVDDITLRPISVNSSTVTVAIPVDLPVGMHTVSVKSSSSEDVWSATLTVNAPLSPTPTPPPSTPVVALTYPAPTLRRPPNGYRFEKPTDVELGWDWQGPLGENEYFAVRIYPRGDPDHSVTWTQGTTYRADLYGEPAGDYCWHIVILRGTGHDSWTQLSPRSEEWCFYAVWPSEPPEPRGIDDIAPTREF